MEGLADININSLDLVLRMEIQEQLKEIIKSQATIQHDVNNIRQGLSNVQSAQARIENYLHNDPATGQDGLVRKVDIHHNVFNDIKSKEVFERIDLIEDKVDKIEEREKVAEGKRTVWTIVFGAVGSFVFWLLKIIIT